VRNLFEASLDFDIYDTGPASGVVISRLTVMNVTNASLNLDLFCYTDLDIANTAGDDVVSGSGTSHFVTDITGVSIEVRALGADRSAVAAYPVIRTQLSNALFNNLSNSLPPFTGDYTGAFQWENRTLQPFEQRTFQVVMAANNTANALPRVEHFGSGNGRTFEIDTQTLLLQDNAATRLFSVRMKGALPNAEHRVVTGFQAIPGGLPVFQNFGGNGVPLLVDPFSFIGIYFGFTDAQGQAEVLFLDVLVTGVKLAEGLQNALEETVTRLPIPKVMTYQLEDGWSSVNFVRPAHGLVALHGSDVVPLQDRKSVV
jgi:hypothetical protein